MGLDKDEIEARVKDAMNLVGLDYESLKDKSPFNLSGGQKKGCNSWRFSYAPSPTNS